MPNLFVLLLDLPDSNHVSGSLFQCFMLVFTTVTLRIKHIRRGKIFITPLRELATELYCQVRCV